MDDADKTTTTHNKLDACIVFVVRQACLFPFCSTPPTSVKLLDSISRPSPEVFITFFILLFNNTKQTSHHASLL